MMTFVDVELKIIVGLLFVTINDMNACVHISKCKCRLGPRGHREAGGRVMGAEPRPQQVLIMKK